MIRHWKDHCYDPDMVNTVTELPSLNCSDDWHPFHRQLQQWLDRYNLTSLLTRRRISFCDEKHKYQHRKICEIIRTRLSQAASELVNEIDTVYAMVEKLEETYEPEEIAKLELFGRLYKASLHNGGKLEHYLKEHVEIRNTLKNKFNHDLGDAVHTMFMLNGLLPDWAAFIANMIADHPTALKVKPTVSNNFNSIVAIIRAERKRIRKQRHLKRMSLTVQDTSTALNGQLQSLIDPAMTVQALPTHDTTQHTVSSVSSEPAPQDEGQGHSNVTAEDSSGLANEQLQFLPDVALTVQATPDQHITNHSASTVAAVSSEPAPQDQAHRLSTEEDPLSAFLQSNAEVENCLVDDIEDTEEIEEVMPCKDKAQPYRPQKRSTVNHSFFKARPNPFKPYRPNAAPKTASAASSSTMLPPPLASSSRGGSGLRDKAQELGNGPQGKAQESDKRWRHFTPTKPKDLDMHPSRQFAAPLPTAVVNVAVPAPQQPRTSQVALPTPAATSSKPPSPVSSTATMLKRSKGKDKQAHISESITIRIPGKNGARDQEVVLDQDAFSDRCESSPATDCDLPVWPPGTDSMHHLGPSEARSTVAAKDIMPATDNTLPNLPMTLLSAEVAGQKATTMAASPAGAPAAPLQAFVEDGVQEPCEPIFEACMNDEEIEPEAASISSDDQSDCIPASRTRLLFDRALAKKQGPPASDTLRRDTRLLTTANLSRLPSEHPTDRLRNMVALLPSTKPRRRPGLTDIVMEAMQSRTPDVDKQATMTSVATQTQQPVIALSTPILAPPASAPQAREARPPLKKKKKAKKPIKFIIHPFTQMAAEAATLREQTALPPSTPYPVIDLTKIPSSSMVSGSIDQSSDLLYGPVSSLHLPPHTPATQASLVRKRSSAEMQRSSQAEKKTCTTDVRLSSIAGADLQDVAEAIATLRAAGFTRLDQLE